MHGDRRLAISARTIVALGVWGLLMVLLGTNTVGIGLAFFVGMGLLFATVITIILVSQRRDTGPEP